MTGRRLPAGVLWAVAAGAGGELCAVGLIASAAWLIARAGQHPPLSALALAIVGVRGFALFRGTLRYVERLTGHDAALRMLAGLRVQVYEALRRSLDPAAQSGTPTNSARGSGASGSGVRASGVLAGDVRVRLRDADLVQRVVADVESVQDLLLRCFLPAAVAWTAGLGATVLCVALSPVAGAVLAAGIVVVGAGLPAGAAVAARSASRRVAGARGDLAVHAHDVAEGADDLAVFGATERFVARADVAAARLERLERRAAAVGAAVNALGTALQGLVALAVLWTAQRQGAGSVLVTVLTLTALTAVECVLPVAEAARVRTEVRASARRVAEVLAAPDTPTSAGRVAHVLAAPDASASADRVTQVLAAPDASASAGPVAQVLAAPDTPTSAGRVVGAVGFELRHVRVAYGGTVALDGVDLEIPAGRKVAVVGASGAGKSTLLGVLTGEVLAGGAVLFGGAPLDAYEPASVRAAVRGLTQDAHVFAASVRANVALARPDASAAELDDAARRVGLLGWIRSLPDGWETVVGEGRLSGGQRQRLLLARALLADPPVLLLDEPTEGLDLATADRLVADLLTGERTVVLVTHRLAPLAAADEVVVLDRGKVVQRGPHDALVVRAGPYRELWAAELLQTGQFPVTQQA